MIRASKKGTLTEILKLPSPATISVSKKGGLGDQETRAELWEF